MKVLVGFPWRATPEREEVFEFTKDWWADTLPDSVRTCLDTQHQPFNLNACRNEIVRAAEAYRADVVVICDADVVMSDRLMTRTIVEVAAQSRELHMPFTLQRYLTRDETSALMQSHPSFDGLPGSGVGNGCCYICRPEVWWRFGGADENFIGWGGDDDQIVACASTLVGLRRYLPVAYSLHHADECRPIGSPAQQRNATRALRYWEAAGSHIKIRKLIQTREQEWT